MAVAVVLLAIAATGCANGSNPGDTGTLDPDIDTVDTWYDPDVDSYDPGWEPDVDASGAGIVGDRCTTASQCAAVPGSGRLCLTTFMSYMTFPGGYCSAVCTSAADCGAGAVCQDLYGFDTYCLETCTTDAQCRTSEGYGCTTLTGATGTFCLPPTPDPDTATD